MQSAQVFSLEDVRFSSSQSRSGPFEAHLLRSAVVGFSLLEPVSAPTWAILYSMCFLYYSSVSWGAQFLCVFLVSLIVF
jgi:hypothetical protein